MIREYKNTSSAIGELYVRSRFFCNKKSHLRYRVVDRSHYTRDFHFPLRIKAKISEYAPILTFQITLSFMVIRIENTPDFYLALGQQRKKISDFHKFTAYAEFGD